MKEAAIESCEVKPPVFWKTILVPIDFSDLSKEAVRIAVCLAEQCDAKIILLHVVDLLNASSIETGMAAYEVMDSARRSLDEIAAENPTASVSQKLVCFGCGGVSQKIIEIAGEVSSDLIVLTAHACSPFKRVLFGSNAEDVERHAPCEVLIVRQKQHFNNKIVRA